MFLDAQLGFRQPQDITQLAEGAPIRIQLLTVSSAGATFKRPDIFHHPGPHRYPVRDGMTVIPLAELPEIAS